MNYKLGIIIGVVLLAAIGAVFFYMNSASAAIGNLNIYSGSANVVRGSNTIPGANGTEISSSDIIRVPVGSRVSIILKDGSEVRLEGGTEVVVSDIAHFDLKSGKIWSHVAPQKQGKEFQVETPTVVATVRGTNFDVTYLNEVSDVYVGAGTVWAALRTDPGRTVAISAGNELTVRDASPAADFAIGPVPATPDDDWTNFNRTTDSPIEPDIAPGATGTPAPTTTATSSPKQTTTTIKPSTSPPPPPAPPTQLPPPPPPPGITLKSLDLSVQNATVSQNDTDQLTVVASFSDGTTPNVTKQVLWTVSPALNIVDTSGRLHATFTGQVTIKATLYGVDSNTVTIIVNQVTQQAVTLSRIAVSCQIVSNQYITAQLVTAQCSATGYYSDGSTSDITSQVAWTASPGSIDAKGYYQSAQGGTVTAALGGVTGQATVLP